MPGPASSVILSFSMFVNSYGGNFVNPIGLDFTDGANQHGRVDLLTAGAGAFATTTAAGLIRNFYTGTDAGTNPHAYTSYSFDITPQVGAGGTFQLRFAEADNQLFLNLGVDNVSVDFTAAGVPEPGSFFLILLPVAAIATLHLRKQQKA